MKKIEAYIKAHRLDDVTLALHKVEHLGGMSVTLLAVIGLYLVYEGIARFFSPTEIIGWLMAAAAGLAIVIDVGTAVLLWAMSKGSLNVRATCTSGNSTNTSGPWKPTSWSKTMARDQSNPQTPARGRLRDRPHHPRTRTGRRISGRCSRHCPDTGASGIRRRHAKTRRQPSQPSTTPPHNLRTTVRIVKI